ncbi:MAG: T9SS type A sorting domain-containing protein, partial [Ginsengibacter sp.]
VTLIHFSAQMQHKGVAIKWVTENELSIQEYVVEKSGDGMHFYSIQKANAKNRAANNYESQDKEPAAGNNYYRLKIVHHNGKIEYSEIEHVVGNNEPSNYSMMPNPIVNGVVNVQFINQMHGNYQLRLTNINGQLISMKSIYYKGENNLKLFNINSLADGIYYLEIINPENETNVLKVIK